MRHQVICDKLAELTGKEVLQLQGKGGFWIRGEGFLSLANARRKTGIAVPSRPKQVGRPSP